MDEIKSQEPKPLREYSKNSYLIPKEMEINPISKDSMLKTSDQQIYVRNGTTGSITSFQKKIKGKAARKADKRNRRVRKS